MLSLQLKSGEYLTIGDDIVVQVFEQGGTIRVAVKAPRELPILRGEVRERDGQRPDGLLRQRPKTTFITALCHVLGVRDDAVASPTFAIVNEYLSGSGESIYHFDFYRITKDAEALDIGLYDYLDSGCLCLMEWPENIEDLLPEETLKVGISVLDDGTRAVTWED